MKVKSNYRVICYPDSGLWGEEAQEKHANMLMHEIKRHCDSLSNCNIKYDFICSFCGNDWKNSLDENGCPICCNEAMEEHNKIIDKDSK